MVQTSGIKILADNLLPRETVLRDVRIIRDWSVWQMVERQSFLYVWVDSDSYGISVFVMNHPVPGVERRNGSDCGDALRLANALIVEKEKCSFLNDGTADRSAEL